MAESKDLLQSFENRIKKTVERRRLLEPVGDFLKCL